MDGPRHTRKVIRFPLEAPTLFWWMDRGTVRRCEGRTRDISEDGAFVFSSTCPPRGIQIGLKVFLPVIPGMERDTRMEADGQVVRVEQARGCKEREGFAVLTQHMVLRVNNEIDERGERGGNEAQLS